MSEITKIKNYFVNLRKTPYIKKYSHNKIEVFTKHNIPLTGLTYKDFELKTHGMLHRPYGVYDFDDGTYLLCTYRPIEKIRIVKKGYKTKFFDVNK